MTHKAPGRSHRNGITLMQLTDMFPDEESARDWFEGIVWPEGKRHCPECGSTDIAENSGRMPYRCRDCNKYFSVKTGTVMAKSQVTLRAWLFALYLDLTSLKGVSSMKLHRDLGVTQKTAWFIQQRIREAFSDLNPDGEMPFTGAVEIDETLVGGKARGSFGGGKLNKAIVMGARERDTKRVRARVVPSTKKEVTREFVTDTMSPGGTLMTDENPSYRGIVDDHQTVCHSAYEYVRDMASTNGIESFWATLKRAYKGTFHKLSHKHLSRYVDEFAGRHNVRDRDTLDQMAVLTAAMVGKRIEYEVLVGPPQNRPPFNPRLTAFNPRI